MPFTQVPHVIQDFLVVGGISDKSLFGINSTFKFSSSWRVLRMDPLLKLLPKTWLAFFFKRQDEDDNKGGWKIFKNHHPNKSYNMTRIDFIILAPAHVLNNWTLLCSGESMYSSGFCLISSNTTMWNIYDGERSTRTKLIKLHMKSRQSLGQQICREVLFTSIQIRNMNGLGALVQREEVKSESPSSIGFTVSAYAHDLNDWTMLSRGENICPEH